MKQTAIEWLEEQIYSTRELDLQAVINQAKEMEKEQITEAHFEGQSNQDEGFPIQISKQYYNETFKSE